MCVPTLVFAKPMVKAYIYECNATSCKEKIQNMSYRIPPWYYDADTMEKYADVLLWALNCTRKAPLRKSDVVVVRYDLYALPLAEEVVAALHRQGRIPVPRAAPTDMMRREFYLQGNNKRLTYEVPGERELLQRAAGTIRLLAPGEPDAMAGVNPEMINIAQRSDKGLNSMLAQREHSGDYGWTVGLYPSPGGAKAAGMPLEEYARQIETACLLHTGTPVNEWKLMRRRIQAVADRLNAMPIHALRVQSKRMDFLVRLGARRRWLGFTGRNMPSYEIYTSPDWRGTEGSYYADLPGYRFGIRVSGLKLHFRLGELMRLEAREGSTMVKEQLRIDSGAGRIGEFALVDKTLSPVTRYMGTPLYDENYTGEHGSCHIALGQSYLQAITGAPPLNDETGMRLGCNYSALHWDLVNTEPKEVFALLDGGGKERIYVDGSFTV